MNLTMMANVLQSMTIEKYAVFEQFFLYHFYYILVLLMVQYHKYWSCAH